MVGYQWHNQNVNDSTVQNCGYQTVTQSKREWFRCTKLWLVISDTIKTWMIQLYKTVVIRQWHNQNVNDLGVQNCGWLSVTQSKREWFNCTKLWLSDSDTIKTWMIQLYKTVVIRQWHNQNVNDSTVQNCGYQTVTQSKREWFSCTNPYRVCVKLFHSFSDEDS